MGGEAEDRDGGGRVVSDTAPRDSGARELAPQAPRVFISYAWEDDDFKLLVKRLATRLRTDGVNARLDAWHARGITFPEFMDREVRHADRVLVVCSPGYRRKVHAMADGEKVSGVGWETMLVTGGLFHGSLPRDKLSVVLLRGNWLDSAPDFLRTTPSIDLSNSDTFEAQYRELLRELTGRTEKAPSLGSLPGDIDPEPVEPLVGTGVERPPEVPNAPPTTWSIPEERNHHFTGRDDLLEQLRTALTQRKTGAVTQAVRGLGGVGKTQLALEYAYRFAGEYEGVWWLHAEDPLTLARDYVDLAPKLGLPKFEDQAQAVREVRDQLRQRQRFLLVFDNATEPKTLKPYLPVGLANHVIITTRAHTWQGSRAVEVHEFALDVAIKFLLDRTGQDDGDAAEEIAKRLGCLPLALEQAAAYVGECEIGLGEYARLLRERGLEVLEQGAPHQYEQTVGTTWTLAFEQVRKRCPAAADLLKLCAFFGPEAIHLSELAKVKEKLPESLAKLLSDDLPMNEARAHLLNLSLIRVEGSAISIHRLVQEVTRQSLVSNGRKRWLSTALDLFSGRRSGQDERQQWLGAALRVLDGLVPRDSDDVRTWPECARWIPHALAAVNRDGAEDLEPGACSRILDRAGTYHQYRADYAAAEPMFRRALAIREVSLGPNHSDVAESLNDLALLLSDTNRHSEAEPMYRRAIDIGEASLGPDHPDVAVWYNNLALLLRTTNRPDEAEPLFRRALAIWEASLGPDHPQVATGLNNLAGLLRDTNRLDEAEAMYRRALAISEASLGPDHPDGATRLNNLATLLRDTNRLDEAEPLYRRAVRILETSLGDDHPNTVTVRNNLEILLEQRAAEQGEGHS